MIYALYLLFFIITTVLVFVINNFYYFGAFVLFQLFLMIKYKIKIKKLILFIKKNIIILLLVLICNLMFIDFYMGIILFTKLLMVIIATYVNKSVITNERLTIAIEKSLFFIKDKETIYLILTMSLSFIPILTKMIQNINLCLKSRGFKYNLKNLIVNSYVIFLVFINQLLKRMEDVELCLISRGFKQ